MTRKTLLIIAVLLLLALPQAIVLLKPAQAQQTSARLLRHPSYSNGKVAFSYFGDIWIANENGSGVQRLTDHKARDIYPRFSPDGNWIAFSSNRDGNNDVYVMSAQGGKPRQLTFHSADDTVIGWSPDGRKILFTSSRNNGVFPSVATLWEISAEGGMEQPVQTDWGSSGSYSPDGSKLAFTRHPGTWSRKHYRGSAAADLWVMNIAAKTFNKLGDDDYKGNRLWPMYGRNGDIYFVSNEVPNEKNVKFGGPEVMKSVNNIWKISDKGGKAVQVTRHTDGNLFFPSISADGKVIVYEDNFGLWKLDTASGKSTEININIMSDTKDNDVELVTINNEAESFYLSPSNRRAAIIAHGELFTIATDRGEVQRVTETFWREQDPRWSPNGKWIAFVSDRTGRQEVYLADEMGHSLKQLTDVDCDKTSVVWSPDSKLLMWSGSDHKLRRVDVESGKTDVLVSSEVSNITSPQFSPDGKWISYTKQDNLLRNHVWVKQLETGAEHMIGSDDFLLSSSAKWTPDGRKLVFLAGYGAPGMSSLNRTTLQLFSVALTRIERDPNAEREVDTEEQAQAAADAARGANRGQGANANTPARVEVKIEWSELDRRIKQLTRMNGSVSSVVPSPDSRTYALMATGGDDTGGGPGLYTIAEDGTRLTRLNTTPQDAGGGGGRGRGAGGGGGGFSEPQWSRDGRSIYYLQGGGIYSVAVGAQGGDNTPAQSTAGGNGRGGRGGAPTTTAPTTTANSAAPRRITFTVRLEIDRVAERKQVFNEAWRVMKNRFYDPKMHGVNWAAAKDTYEPMLTHIADTDELHNVVMEMIGELNASHTGISGGGGIPGQAQQTERVQTRYPGFNMEPDASGYYKVSYIYKKGPADHDFVKLAPGNYILALNGKELKTKDNYWKLFNLQPGRKFEFTVNSKPSPDGAWTVALEPLTGQAQNALEYDRWVDSRREMVTKLSNGEIGYLHIQAMNQASYDKFQRELLENLGKKALVIDERFNGGGGIDQELLIILNQRKQYEAYRNRDSSVLVPRPFQAFFGPMAVLQNERSGSNAEMFPEGFRTLGLGTLIGVPTAGGVIGTGSFTMLDGSSLRTPSVGVYTAKGENFENYGVPPDVWIDNGPADFLGGHDRQIEKAVEVLRSQMKPATTSSSGQPRTSR